MAAVEMFPHEALETISSRPILRLVEPVGAHRAFKSGMLISQRRAARARMVQRRRRSLAVGAVLVALLLLALPGHAFGGTTATGLPISYETGSQLSPGMVYVVQPGDTLASIARQVNPLNPEQAYQVLASQLRSTVVVPQERIVIP